VRPTLMQSLASVSLTMQTVPLFGAAGLLAAAAAMSFGVATAGPDALQLGLQRDWLWELLPDAGGNLEPWPREQGATYSICSTHLCPTRLKV
jgi:hypothetical protein